MNPGRFSPSPERRPLTIWADLEEFISTGFVSIVPGLPSLRLRVQPADKGGVIHPTLRQHAAYVAQRRLGRGSAVTSNHRHDSLAQVPVAFDQ